MSSIRLADTDDAAAVAAIYAPFVEGTAVSFELEPPSAENMRERIGILQGHYPWLVYVRDGQVMGYAYATRHRERAAYQWSVDVSVYVAESARRCGVARALYHSLFEVLRHQGIYHAYAGIALPNAASVGLHEAFGFVLVGIYRAAGYKLGAWHDVGWWDLALQPPDHSPATPRALAEVGGLADLLASGQRWLRA